MERDDVSKDSNFYGSKNYWETRFKSEEQYDWLCSYDNYKSILEPLLKPKDKILILGMWNSLLFTPLAFLHFNIVWRSSSMGSLSEM